jgi:hypothetical protein
LGYGRVVGGRFINATISTNRRGELSLQPGGVAALKKRPTLTAETVASWQEIISETRGGAVEAASKMGQAVAHTVLPATAGKATAAAIGSAVESMKSAQHIVRVDWVDGEQSLIQLPDKLFQHLAIMLKARQLPTVAPPPTPAESVPTPAESAPTPAAPPTVIEQLTTLAGSVRASQPDVAEQIAKLGALRDQGVLSEEEFAAKKTELLERI